MPGPLSAPNGDTRIVRGHINEEFVCDKHFDKEFDVCLDRQGCVVIPLRQYLAKRNRLVTGKTK
jgi:hypothetical protein